ncbi:MAG: alpha-amylase family glycosyl hydrolase, partial [Calditrichaceae bacterium]
MKINYQNIYNKFIKKYHIFGIESEFYNCSNIVGPAIPEWIIGQVIYEIYVRAFSKEGTFKGIQDNLERVKSLGIDIVWFMPIYPIGKIRRKGSLGCPYSVQDYFNVNPEYGSNSEFKNLIETAHDLGMRVILDLVINHVSHDYVGFEKHPEIALRDKNGNPTRKVADWSDVIDLDYSNRSTWHHVLDIMQYWIKEFDIDGYRCDVAGLVPTEFWEWAVPQIQSLKKDIFMLAEWESPLLHKKIFHSTYDWIFYSIILDVINGKTPVNDIADWIETKNRI